MTREEYRKKLSEKVGNESDVIRLMIALDNLIKSELPPAEGAEAQRCPVCGGNGLVPNGFYNTVSGIWSTTSITPETCRSCNGTGVIFFSQQQPTAEGAEEIQPTAYEWHNYKTGHCYVDYIPHLDAKEGYVKTPLYTPLHAQRIAEKMAEKMSPSNEQIHAAALAWARDHSEAPDKDCPDWLIRDYEAGAYFVRQCYGCWNKTEQPTAEGAEEILDAKEIYLDLCFKNIQFEDRLKLVVMAMEKYATLHAQRIADKKYADTEADGYVFCGKCGKMKEI